MSVFKPIKCTSSQLSNLSVIDGQVIFTTDSNEIYLDNDGFRSKYNSGSSGDIPLVYNIADWIGTITNGKSSIVNSSNYGWIRNGNAFYPNNYNKNSSNCYCEFTTTKNIDNLKLTGTYNTEANYDKITVKVGSTVVLNNASGVGKTISNTVGSVPAGTLISLLYSKDSSQNAANETVNLVFDVGNLTGGDIYLGTIGNIGEKTTEDMTKHPASVQYVNQAIFGALGGSY